MKLEVYGGIMSKEIWCVTEFCIDYDVDFVAPFFCKSYHNAVDYIQKQANKYFGQYHLDIDEKDDSVLSEFYIDDEDGYRFTWRIFNMTIQLDKL